MSALQSRIIAALLIFAFAASPICAGFQVGSVVITPTTVSLAIAAALTVSSRFMASLPLVPMRALCDPAIVSTIVYFSIGLSTGFIADDKAMFFKEVIQRTTIIWLPLFGVSMGLRKIKYAKYMLLAFVASCGLLAAMMTAVAVSTKFGEPVYLFGLHKNNTSSLCATMAIICAAHLMSSKRKFIQLSKAKLPNRLLFGSALALAMLGILAAQGRAALLEVLIATYVMMFTMKAKKRTMIALTIACVLGTFIIFKIMPEKALEHVVTTQRHSANAVRIEIWTDMAKNFMENPFIASGWGNAFIDRHGFFYYDLACVLLFDWMQMSIIGALALLAMMGCTIRLALTTAKRAVPNSVEGFVGLAALGIIAGKFTHSMLDTFWIARGANLHAWTAVGLTLFLKFWLDQNQRTKPQIKAAVTAGEPR